MILFCWLIACYWSLLDEVMQYALQEFVVNPDDAPKSADTQGMLGEVIQESSEGITAALRPCMVRMRVGQTPDWDKIETERVLEAWTASEGDLHQMAALLSGVDGDDSDAKREDTTGVLPGSE
jgi:hypothetical protein